MPRNLVRYQQSGQSHFVTFSCYRRQARFDGVSACDRFVVCLEETRRRFRFYVYGYVVMPEHVHLLLSEPMKGSLADALHDLKMNFARNLPGATRDLSGRNAITTAMSETPKNSRGSCATCTAIR